MRQILNGIFYVLQSGGAWRLLPHDYPAWSTVYDYFRKWRNAGVWEQLVRTLRERLRLLAPGGGFVFNTIHNVQQGTPPQNIAAAYDAARQAGRYPLA